MLNYRVVDCCGVHDDDEKVSWPGYNDVPTSKTVKRIKSTFSECECDSVAAMNQGKMGWI